MWKISRMKTASKSRKSWWLQEDRRREGRRGKTVASQIAADRGREDRREHKCRCSFVREYASVSNARVYTLKYFLCFSSHPPRPQAC